MTLPDNITNEHLLAAIQKINEEGIPSNGDSRYYDVLYQNKRYPPKLVVSYANYFANGYALDRNTFEGGQDQPAFKLLKRFGFEIVQKENFKSEILKFLDQANEGKDLTSAKFVKQHGGLQVKVSFGQGNTAQVPWIAFLGGTDTVQEGIYPVFLFYKKEGLLILAAGVSETKKTNRKWPIANPLKILDFFHEENLGKPVRYGDSIVYKVYNLRQSEVQSFDFDADLDSLIDIYQKTLTFIHSDERFEYLEFAGLAQQAHLKISSQTLVRFIAALLTKRFLILTGLSGSGKSKLALAFAKWITAEDKQICVVPVGADWTNREPLLGFPNALEKDSYIQPDNGALSLILEAGKEENQTKPYFLILDEMNLSHVERYFADFLSAMESGQQIGLHSDEKRLNDVPAKINLPSNLFIIGTVNIDETTYMFSPKVLDRANVIEFRVDLNEMKQFLDNHAVTNLAILERGGKWAAHHFVKLANDDIVEAANIGQLRIYLLQFFRQLKAIGAEFGYRTASEIMRFSSIILRLEPSWSVDMIADAAIVQKLLPKVHGSRRKLEPVLKLLASLCVNEEQNVEQLLSNKGEKDLASDSNVKFPLSLEKLSRMYRNLLDNGFTSFAEA